MGIWVVVLEAVAGEDPGTIEPDDLDALAEVLAESYPQVTGGPAFYQAEFWVEESNSGGAVMQALRLWQAAVRELGMPPWDVVRAEARDAHAIEAGLIEWAPPTTEEAGPEFDEVPDDAEIDAGGFDEDGFDDEDVDGLDDVDGFDDEEVEVEPPPLLHPLAPKAAKVASTRKAAGRKAASKQVVPKKAATKKAAVKAPKKVARSAATRTKKASPRAAKRR